MAKNKLQKFADVDRFHNVFEYTDFEEKPKPKGEWHEKIFKNQNPIVLELACGKGEYTVNLARKYPEKNFIGIDKKGWRLWTGAKTAIEEPLPNVHFIRMYIDHLGEYFDKDEVEEIWITFPDPYLRKSKSSKRLTSPKFLDIYRTLLKEKGVVHLKTDSEPLYRFTLEVIKDQNLKIMDRCDDVYAERPDDPILTILTYYEQMHLEEGRTIYYVSFRPGKG
ncbi:MAG: tRNA (guanosine(46)-N7)-methyltransferase TrmB [Balneolaceae bacterium]|nr:tRNA (guanosine(46)-N7)-methyltransferase TrmB [Balneolaceae bacterium]MCH8549422.1 tRNA (guanosine(46)-N7)-methyltransferase TrmB [Balneolaceae bacterium]